MATQETQTKRTFESASGGVESVDACVKRMKPLRLCLGYVIIGHGGGDGFAINIDVTASLEDLMNAIKKAHPRIILGDIAGLQLYVAKKRNAKWLQDDDSDAISLSLGEPDVVAKYVDHDLRIRRTRSIGSYFSSVVATSDDVTNPDGVIHVIVLLPKPSTAQGCADNSATESENMVLEIGDLGFEHAMQIRNKLGLGASIVSLKEPVNSSVEPFAWDPNEAEGDQKDRYLAYLRSLFPTVGDFAKDGIEELYMEDASTDETLLYVEDERLPFGMRGPADIAVVDSSAKEHKELRAGIKALIVARREISSKDKAQAFAQLVAISLNAPERSDPMVLLTDLNDNWYFYWLNDHYTNVDVEDIEDEDREDSLVMQARITHPTNAIDFLVAAASSGEYYFQVPFEELTLGTASINKLVPRIIP